MRLTRRQFVTTTVAAACALPLSPTRRPPARCKKAVKLGMVHTGATLLEKFELLAELGFDGVEPDSPNDLDTEELLAAAAATGIAVHGVVDSAHWHKPFSAADPAVRAAGSSALRRAIADAKAYGATTVLVVPGVVSHDVRYDEAWERSLAEIRQVLPDAERAGIKLAFENVWNNFLLSPLEFARFIDAFASPWVGAYFDVGNVVKYGWPAHWIGILGKRILKVDVKGYSHKTQFAAPIGEDDCDWASVRDALAEIGYAGWATAEVDGGDRARLADIAARMDHVLHG